MPRPCRPPSRSVRARWLFPLAVVALLLPGCSGDDGASPGAQRGRQVYSASCIACHNPDPAKPGALGPPVKGSSQELLAAKVLEGRYPPGYAPKRPTQIMQPLPGLAADIPALAEFLK